METIELSPTQRNVPWPFALAVGGVVALLSFYASQKVLPALDASPISSFDIFSVILGACIAIGFGGLKSAVILQASQPPLLIKKRSWFGILQATRRIPLTNVVWARVVYAEEVLLSVEVGTLGHETTSIVCLPYSEQNIPVAEQLCSKVAGALHLENKGCHRYV